MNPVHNAGPGHLGRLVRVAGGSTNSWPSIILAPSRGEAGTDSCSLLTHCSTQPIARARCWSDRGLPCSGSMFEEIIRPASLPPSDRARPLRPAIGTCPLSGQAPRRKPHRNATSRISLRARKRDMASASIAGAGRRSGGGVRRSPKRNPRTTSSRSRAPRTDRRRSRCPRKSPTFYLSRGRLHSGAAP
jgi:hypothetical protein